MGKRGYRFCLLVLPFGKCRGRCQVPTWKLVIDGVHQMPCSCLWYDTFWLNTSQPVVRTAKCMCRACCAVANLKRRLLHKAILTRLCFHPHNCSPRALSTPLPPSNLHLLSPWWWGQISWVCRWVPTSNDWRLCFDPRSFLGAWGVGGSVHGCSWVLGFRLDLCSNVLLSVLHYMIVDCRNCILQSDCMGCWCFVIIRRRADSTGEAHTQKVGIVTQHAD